MDEVLKELADGAGIEFAGGKKSIPPPQVISDELGNLSMTWDDDKIQAQINNIDRARRDLNCVLSIRDYSVKPTKWISAPVRINLLSDSAKAGLKRSLNERRGLDWATRLDQIVVAVHEAADGLRQVGVLKPRSTSTQRDWLLSPITERGQHSMIVAAGGTGKSMLALALFASAATGVEIIPGIKPAPFQGNCLYLDWETDQATHELRLTQICSGLGIPFPENRIHYIRMAVPLAEDTEFLYQYIIKNRIKFGVGDSVGMATAGDINSQADAIAYVNAVRALGDLTFLSVHHVGWGDTSRNTGSRYFENAARSVWVLEKEQDAAANDSHVDLVHRKSNNGILESSIGVRVEFGDAIRYYADEVSEDKQPASAKILDALTMGKMRLSDLYEEMANTEKPAIRKALERLIKSGKVLKWESDRKNPEFGLSVTPQNRHSDITDRGSVTKPPLKGGGFVSQPVTPAFGDRKEEIRMPYKEQDDDPIPSF